MLVLLDLFTRTPPPTLDERGPLLTLLSPERAATLLLSSAEGAQLELARGPAGWVVPGLRDFPAAEYGIRDFLRRLGGLSRADVVAREAETARALTREEGVRRIEVLDADGRHLADVTQLPPRLEVAGSYVRVQGSVELCRAASLEPVALESVAWLDTRLFTEDAGSVHGIELSGAAIGKPLSLERRADGSWSAAGRDVPRSLARRLVGAATGLVFSSVEPAPAGPVHGLEPPELEIALATGDGTRVLLHVGGTGAEGDRFATRADWSGAWVVVVPGTLAAELESALAAVRDALD